MSSGLQLQRDFAKEHRLKTEQKQVLYGGAVLYAFKGCSHQDVSKAYAKAGIDNSRSVVLDLRRDLWSNGALLLDGKSFAYSLIKDGSPPRRCELSISDRRAIQSSLDWKPLHKYLRLLAREGWDSMPAKRISHLIGRALHNKDIRSYVDKFAYRKHSFLESYGMSQDIVKSDMMSWALYALLKAYPRWNDAGHMLAIAKTAIHNRGINIISEAVSSGRQSLRRLPDGTYENLIVPWETLPSADADTSDAYITTSFLYVGIDGTNSNRFEDNLALKQLANYSSFKPKQRLFISLLLGTPNDEFTAYLGTCNAAAAASWSFDKYMGKVCRFLGVPHDAAQAFLESLRNHL